MNRKFEIKTIWQYLKRNQVFWIVSLFTFFVFFLTCARHLTWKHDGADGGDLALCAYTLGCPHPTGYPLYCLSGWLFTHLFPFGEVAFRLNVYSAIFAALGSAFISLAVREASDFLFPSVEESWRRKYIPILSGLCVAFSFSYWSQALIVEVYSLNAFFTAVVLYYIVRIIKTDSKIERDRLFSITAFWTGLGLTNHLSMIYILFAGIITLIYLRYIPSLRTFLKSLAFFLLPLLLYAYLPIRSNMMPLMDWGDPENWSNFLWVLSGQQFKRLVFASLFTQILYRIYGQINLIQQIQVTGLIASFCGIVFFLLGRGQKKWAFFVLVSSTLILNLIHIANYLVIDPLSFLLPFFMMVSLLGGLGTGWLINLALSYQNSKGSRNLVSSRLILRMSKVFAVAIPMIMLLANYDAVDLSKDSQGYDYAKRAFEKADPGSLIFETYYGRGLTLLYYHHVEGMGKEKNITPIYVEQLQFFWGKKNFKERYPNIVGPDLEDHYDNPIAHDIIRRNFDSYTMYFGRMFYPPKGYDFEPAGDLFKVVKAKKQAIGETGKE